MGMGALSPPSDVDRVPGGLRLGGDPSKLSNIGGMNGDACTLWFPGRRVGCTPPLMKEKLPPPNFGAWPSGVGGDTSKLPRR